MTGWAGIPAALGISERETARLVVMLIDSRREARRVSGLDRPFDDDRMAPIRAPFAVVARSAVSLVGDPVDAPCFAPPSSAWHGTAPVAEMLGVSRQRVRTLIRTGRLRGTDESGSWLIDPESVEEMMRERVTDAG